MDRPMGPDLIDGNQFQITVRKLAPEAARSIVEESLTVKESGFPNYFDDQRFGSYDPDQGFLAEKLLLGHFNGAAKIAMTSLYSENSKEDLERKKFFADNWKDWAACSSKAVTDFERWAFETLKMGEKGCLAVVNQLPKEELSMYFSAYQSFLWNETARAVIKEKIQVPLTTVPGDAGPYLFYSRLNDDVLSCLQDLRIPTAAHNAKMPDALTTAAYDKVLQDRGVKKPMFNKLKIRRAFFKATERALIIVPRDLSVAAIDDDQNSGLSKAVLDFTLPRGSYATMLIKRLFCKNH
jgi:tRNA pseudouridine13 synthase